MRKSKIKIKLAGFMMVVFMTSCSINGQDSLTSQMDDNNLTSENVPYVADLSNTVSDNILPDSNSGVEISATDIVSLSGNMILKLSKYDQLTYYNEDTATVIEGIIASEKDQADEVNIVGEGAVINDNQISLVESGTYILRGEFINKSFYINIADDKKIHLVLDGVKITSNTTAPIYGAFGDKLIITLTDNSENEIADAAGHANDSANGCLYSTMDTTINGAGSLTINGKYNNGIAVKSDLKICGSAINIIAANNGIKGNNSVSIINSDVIINAKDDGIKVTEEEDREKGFTYISNSVVEITSDDDVIQATNGIVIRNNSEVRGRSYGSFLNCKTGYIEGEEYTRTWE